MKHLPLAVLPAAAYVVAAAVSAHGEESGAGTLNEHVAAYVWQRGRELDGASQTGKEADYLGAGLRNGGIDCLA